MNAFERNNSKHSTLPIDQKKTMRGFRICDSDISSNNNSNGISCIKSTCKRTHNEVDSTLPLITTAAATKIRSNINKIIDCNYSTPTNRCNNNTNTNNSNHSNQNNHNNHNKKQRVIVDHTYHDHSHDPIIGVVNVHEHGQQPEVSIQQEQQEQRTTYDFHHDVHENDNNPSQKEEIRGGTIARNTNYKCGKYHIDHHFSSFAVTIDTSFDDAQDGNLVNESTPNEHDIHGTMSTVISSSTTRQLRRISTGTVACYSKDEIQNHCMTRRTKQQQHDAVPSSSSLPLQQQQQQNHLSTVTTSSSGAVAVAFPEHLHEMLSAVEREGLAHIISWQPHGRCFLIHDKEAFVSQIVNRFFHQTKLTSFQRQLNLYGFIRLTAGRDRGAYYHELFLRGRIDLCRGMARRRIKGNGMKAASSPSTEPNFYEMEYCTGTTSSSSITVAPLSFGSSTTSMIIPPDHHHHHQQPMLQPMQMQMQIQQKGSSSRKGGCDKKQEQKSEFYKDLSIIMNTFDERSIVPTNAIDNSINNISSLDFLPEYIDIDDDSIYDDGDIQSSKKNHWTTPDPLGLDGNLIGLNTTTKVRLISPLMSPKMTAVVSDPWLVSLDDPGMIPFLPMYDENDDDQSSVVSCINNSVEEEQEEPSSSLLLPLGSEHGGDDYMRKEDVDIFPFDSTVSTQQIVELCSEYDTCTSLFIGEERSSYSSNNEYQNSISKTCTSSSPSVDKDTTHPSTTIRPTSVTSSSRSSSSSSGSTCNDDGFSDASTLPETGDEVFFEGHKFHYIDHQTLLALFQ